MAEKNILNNVLLNEVGSELRCLLQTMGVAVPTASTYYEPACLFTPCSPQDDHDLLAYQSEVISPMRYELWGLLWDFDNRAIRWDPAHTISFSAPVIGALLVAWYMREQCDGMKKLSLHALPYDCFAEAYGQAALALKEVAKLRQEGAEDWAATIRRIEVVATVLELTDQFENAAMLGEQVAHFTFGKRNQWRSAEMFYDWKRRVFYCYDALQARTPDLPFYDDMNAGLLFRKGRMCIALARETAPRCEIAAQFVADMEAIEQTLAKLTMHLYVPLAA